MSITIIIIVITAIVSFATFNNQELRSRLIFYPWQMNGGREFFRFISSGFIHADLGHLLFNMFTLFFFGRNLETYLDFFGGAFPEIKFLILYIGSMIMGSMFSYYKHKDNPEYMALGASGAVSGVLFSSFVFDPWGKIYIYAALPIRGILFGIGYLFYSAKMAKQNSDNIGHDAHFYGAVAGILLTLAFNPSVIVPHFIEQIQNISLF